ncbi:WXG100 family type VII secretion target [[Actinomadura] parvosata]|uniref:WXG100 family type VII secretion target n=1 Tax=[Actinomadura] parvosata TaxID=1955412 RepID=UPI00406C2FDA
MGEWQPIRLYAYLGESDPGAGTTREQVVSWLNSTDPDRIEAAGQSYVEAAKLIKGEDGVQDALRRTAEELKDVWRGEGATKALESLRVLFASAGALGTAMHDTGTPMKQYAAKVREYRAALPAAPEENAGGGMLNGGGSGGSGGTGGTGGAEYAPPLLDQNTAGGTFGDPSLSGVLTPDEIARNHLKRLNDEIAEVNARMAEGLSFRMPNVTPLDVALTKNKKIDVGSGSDAGGGPVTYWDGGNGSGSGTGSGSGGGTTGSGAGAGGSGSGSDGTGGTGGSGAGSGGTGGSGTGSGGSTPQDPAAPGQNGQDGSATPSPGDSAQQPGGAQGQQPSGQAQGDSAQDVPPVIGADGRTELADSTTTPTANPGSASNPYQSTAPTTTTVPTPQTPTSTLPTPNPAVQPGVNGGMWYPSGGGAAAAASPAVLRGGATPGSGFMAYPPGAGAGAPGSDGGEKTRDIYDPEPSVWHVPTPTGPDKIG